MGTSIIALYSGEHYAEWALAVVDCTLSLLHTRSCAHHVSQTIFAHPPPPIPQTTPAGAPLGDADAARVKEVNKRLMTQKNLPEFEPVPLTLASLVAEGMRLVQQQDLVNTNKLGEEYMVRGGGSGV